MKLNKSIKNTNISSEKELELLFDTYKEFYLELKYAISELRKKEKNPIIPDALSRNIPSKIKFAEITKTVEDIGKVEIALLEVQKEIEYCEKEKVVNVNNEITEKYKNETMTKEEREKEKE